jgi:hypothetical protein
MPKKPNAARRRKNGGIGDDDGDKREVDMVRVCFFLIALDACFCLCEFIITYTHLLSCLSPPFISYIKLHT